MRSSLENPKEFNTFEYIEILDYTKPVNYTFLMDLNFGPDLADSDDYGSVGLIENKCYTGRCQLNFQIKSTYNCSLACLNGIEYCYDGDKLCESKICVNSYYRYDENAVCLEFNRVKIWKNTQIKKYKKIFEVNRYSHIIPRDGNCTSGYKKCGIINSANDYLCLKEESDCPINSIIVKNSNEAPDSDYKSYLFGDKYIFFSNKKINNYLKINIAIEFYQHYDRYENGDIDNDTLSNVIKYNPHTDTWRSKDSIVYLYSSKLEIYLTSKEMLKMKDVYDNLRTIYTNSTLNEINTEVLEYKSSLMGFGIGAFASFAIIGIIFIPIFFVSGCKFNFPCFLCKDMTPMKRVILFYIVFSPSILLSFVGLIFSIIKKNNYNKLLNKEYFDEYLDYRSDEARVFNDLFEFSLYCNNMQFITFLITLIIIILYPILIKIISSITSCNDNNNNEIDTINKEQNEKIINSELVNYEQGSENLLPEQNNSNNNYYNEHISSKPID